MSHLGISPYCLSFIKIIVVYFVAHLLREPKLGDDALSKQFGELFVAKVANKLCLELARSDLSHLGISPYCLSFFIIIKILTALL